MEEKVMQSDSKWLWDQNIEQIVYMNVEVIENHDKIYNGEKERVNCFNIQKIRSDPEVSVCLHSGRVVGDIVWWHVLQRSQVFQERRVIKWSKTAMKSKEDVSLSRFSSA